MVTSNRICRLRVRIKGNTKFISLVQPRAPIEAALGASLGELVRNTGGVAGYFVCAWDDAGRSDAAWHVRGVAPAFVAGVVNGHLAELATKKVLAEEGLL